MTRLFPYLTVLVAAGALVAPRGLSADDALNAQAYGILKTYCGDCHSKRQEVEGFNVLRRDSLLNEIDGIAKVVPGNPDTSYLWERLGINKDMPPEGQLLPSDEERAIIEKWIADGAVFPPVDDRPFVSNLDMLQAIAADLDAADEDDRSSYRYFTLTNLWNNDYTERFGNNGSRVDDADVRLARAALSKVLNSLSLEPDIAVPTPIDEHATVMRIDLRNYGWNDAVWQMLMSKREVPVDGGDAVKLPGYPYGLKLNVHPDPEKMNQLKDLTEDIVRESGTPLPFIRLDWFVDQASRPALYHTLLSLPSNVEQLEKALRVDVKQDFLNDELDRAGFAESGVSRHNRLVDRHSAVYGYYWKSYDFGNSEGKANLFRNPLGPVVQDDQRFVAFTDHAFEHAGGEMIFSLPNGLQGYYLSEANGKRIDAGPTEIVRDLKEIGGTPAVVNGLSCMHCHKHGVIRFQDTVRNGMALAGAPRDKAERLFATKEEWNRILDKDETRFMEALEEATAEFLLVGEDEGRDLREMREPVGEIAKLYQKDVELEEAAVELGFDNPQELLAVLRGNPGLVRRLGLGPVVNGDAIKRSAWSNLDEFLSPFQRTASELDRGTAHVGF